MDLCIIPTLPPDLGTKEKNVLHSSAQVFCYRSPLCYSVRLQSQSHHWRTSSPFDTSHLLVESRSRYVYKYPSDSDCDSTPQLLHCAEQAGSLRSIAIDSTEIWSILPLSRSPEAAKSDNVLDAIVLLAVVSLLLRVDMQPLAIPHRLERRPKELGKQLSESEGSDRRQYECSSG